MSIETTEKFDINPADPASLGDALTRIIKRIEALHKDVGLLSITIGTLVNAGDAGLLAQPDATREIVRAVLNTYGDQAPLAKMQIEWGLDLPLCSPPPKGRKRLRIVQGEMKAA